MDEESGSAGGKRWEWADAASSADLEDGQSCWADARPTVEGSTSSHSAHGTCFVDGKIPECWAQFPPPGCCSLRGSSEQTDIPARRNFPVMTIRARLDGRRSKPMDRTIAARR